MKMLPCPVANEVLLLYLVLMYKYTSEMSVLDGWSQKSLRSCQEINVFAECVTTLFVKQVGNFGIFVVTHIN